MKESPLGRDTGYATRYDPGLLHSIERDESRRPLGLAGELPFGGVDLWTAWEISWLDANGVPQIAAADIRVPADSPRLVESKSLKLYLGSFAMTRVGSHDELASLIENDLGACTGGRVAISLHQSGKDIAISDFDGHCIDQSANGCNVYAVDAGQLSTSDEPASESLYSHLLRSLCPVTSQPDLGSVLVRYTGPQIDRASLLRYIVSFRQHRDFHEACVERMFLDIADQCRTKKLTVYARYQRRGGIDINPFRSDFELSPEPIRLPRQ